MSVARDEGAAPGGGAGGPPPRVLVIVNRLYEWSQGFITRELVELVRQGVTLHVAARRIVPRDDLDEETAALAARVLPLPENPFTPRCLLVHARFALAHPARYARALRGLARLGHTRPDRALRSVVCLFRAATIAEAVNGLGVELIHAHFLTAPGETAYHLSTLTGSPFGATGHAMDLYVDASGLRGKLAAAAYLVTCTRANASFLTSGEYIDSGKLYVAHHGVDLPDGPGPDSPRGASSAREPAGSGRPVSFLAAGRFVPKKGFDHLIDACGLLASRGLDFECRIVGKGELGEPLRERAEALGLGDRVRFGGYVPPNRMPEVYRGADVLVVPSIIAADGDRDGLPNVCIEAMVHGLAIIGSSVSGIPEGVIDGRNGILVPPGDTEALAAAMSRLLDRPRLRVLQEAAPGVVAERFDNRANVARLVDILSRHGGRHLARRAAATGS